MLDRQMWVITKTTKMLLTITVRLHRLQVQLTQLEVTVTAIVIQAQQVEPTILRILTLETQTLEEWPTLVVLEVTVIVFPFQLQPV